MFKLKIELKNTILFIGFLFRPIIPVTVSFAFLVLTCVLLVVIILNLNESTKVYQVLLSILTGVTASLLIAIMMELYNNYRFNTKRQRELREYFRQLASYELNQSSIIETNAKDEYDSVLGSGRSYAVFSQLKDIICIFRCGGAAVPEEWKPPVRNWKPLLITSTHSVFCLTRRLHALRYLWMDQCFRY